MHCASNTRTPKRQRGYTLLLVLLVLLVGGTSVYLTARDPGTAASAREATERARMLKEARTTVVIYAVLDGVNNRPGALPCPDFNGNGEVSSNCQSGSPDSYIERFPWKTFDLSSNYGELWYVIDSDFRDHPDAEPINVALEGSLTLDDEDGYAALIIDPGEALTDRSSDSSDPSDYLEGENADGDEEFVNCGGIDDCNDRIVGIRVDPLFKIVQLRVLEEIEERLIDFYEEYDRHFFPFAAAFGGDLSCRDGEREGRIATSAGSPPDECEPPGASGSQVNTLRESDFAGVEWILDNKWLEHVVYRVAEECIRDGDECVGADLQLGTETGLSVVLGAAGTELTGQNRVSASPDIADFLDSEENTDGDKVFINAPLSSGYNDILRGFASP